MSGIKWAKVIDERRCIGCHACTVACKSEHQVPLGVTRTFVKQVEVGVFPSVRRNFQVTRCNQCDNPPCVDICPTNAMFQRPDGIVDFNRSTCIGCKACIAACPYDAIYIDPESHSAEKCNFCTHRIDVGLEPACVSVCPTQAIIIGDMNDPESEVSELIASHETSVRRPEKGTLPKLFYVDGVEASLNPLASTSMGVYLATEGGRAVSPRPVVPERVDRDRHEKSKTGNPMGSSAASLIAYHNETRAPWDWRVSGYIWTKSVGTGTFVMAALGAVFATLGDGKISWDVASILVSIAFMCLTGVLLIGDLSHPKRFYTIFTRPHWRSWLVRGALLISVYCLLLGLVLITTLLELVMATRAFQWMGIVLALLVAIYTAFLFNQAKGRDLWQNQWLSVHLLSHTLLAGSAALSFQGAFITLSDNDTAWIQMAFAIALSVHMLLVLIEWRMPHPTEAARYASREMTQGRWAYYFWGGLALAVTSLLVLMIVQVPWVAAVLGLAGLALHQHAYVQAGQSAPQS